MPQPVSPSGFGAIASASLFCRVIGGDPGIDRASWERLAPRTPYIQVHVAASHGLSIGYQTILQNGAVMSQADKAPDRSGSRRHPAHTFFRPLASRILDGLASTPALTLATLVKILVKFSAAHAVRSAAYQHNAEPSEHPKTP